MRDLILKRLKDLESSHNISILYACESGSRAWGFASPNSDWDVRFIYVHHQDWYLSINEQKDSLDFAIDENDLDLSGWELRKTLRLFRKSNASPFEWLQSPIVYFNNYNFQAELWALHQQYFNPRATTYHYLGLAKNSLKKGFVDGKMDIKKYFYILRPLLAAYWICHQESAAPMEFAPLLAQLESNKALHQAIQNLTKQKQIAMEGDWTEPIPIIQDFILKTLDECGKMTATLDVPPSSNDTVNQFFRSMLLRTKTL